MPGIKMFRHRTFSIQHSPVTMIDPYTARGGNLPYTMSKYARNTVVDKVVSDMVGLQPVKAKYVVGTRGVRGLGNKNEYVEQIVKEEPIDTKMVSATTEQVDTEMVPATVQKSLLNVESWIQNLENETSEEEAKSVSTDMQSVADYFEQLDSPVSSVVSDMQSLLENTLAMELKKLLQAAGSSKRPDEGFESVKKRKTALAAYAKIIDGELKALVNQSLKRKTEGEMPEPKRKKIKSDTSDASNTSGSLYLPSESDSLTEGVTGRVLRKRKVKSYRESTSSASS